MSNKKKVYIAGKMRGVPYYNFPAFDAAKKRLEELGFEVFSPADMDRETGFDPTLWWRHPECNAAAFANYDWNGLPSGFDLDAAIKRDNEAIDAADGVYVITEGFSTSAGATAEVERAMKAGKVVVYDTMADAAILNAMGIGKSVCTRKGLCEEQANSVRDFDSARWMNDRILAMRQETHDGRPATVAGVVSQSPAQDKIPFFDTYRGETRYTDPKTGGQKGEKLARFDLLPPDILWELAEHYGKGALKYAERNMELGYPWGKSYAACQRHLNAFWRGEDVDAETGSLHLVAAAWHCVTMAWFYRHGAGTDNRPNVKKEGENK